jgi:hypothetical protein
MAEIEGNPDNQKEFNALENEMEKREKASVFDVPLADVGKSVDALLQKEKDKPNGYGAFIEKRDARETKEVADRYLDADKLTERELMKDFSDGVLGNPTTWYADGLKIREALNEATKRGIDTEKMLADVVKVFTNDGYGEDEAKRVVGNILAPIFNKDVASNAPAQQGAAEVAVEPTATPASPTDQIADLRAKEQAEYDAMPDPNDKAKRKEIYDRYDGLISPLLAEQNLQTQKPIVAGNEIASNMEEEGLVDNNDGTAMYNGIPVKYVEKPNGIRTYTAILPDNFYELTKEGQSEYLTATKELNEIEKGKRSAIEKAESQKKKATYLFGAMNMRKY